MKIAFESDVWVPPVSNALSILTDRAEICVADIHYDEAKKVVEIYMRRKGLTGFKKSFLGEMQPVYGSAMIKSLLTIRQVEEMSIKVDDRLVADCNSCFTALFGLKVEDKRLYLGSAEEIEGNTLCEVAIKVKKLSIEYKDEVD